MLPRELESISPVVFPAVMVCVSVDVNAGVVVYGVIGGIGIVNGLHPSY